MTLSTALSNATSGLVSSGLRAEVTSTNIANASTPGYVRRTVISQEGVLGGRGSGVRSNIIDRAQDMSLTRSRRDADAVAGRTNQTANAYSTLNRNLGAPGADYGLFSDLESLESAFKDLAATPESPALQSAVVAAASQMSDQFNTLAEDAQKLREDTDKGIAQSVDTVNNALYALQDVNKDMASLGPNSPEAAPLEDERQRLIDKIASIIPVRDVPRDHNQVDIVTENGTSLLAGNVFELSFTPTSALPNTVRYPEISGVPSGLFVGNQDITPGNGEPQSISNGKLAGQFAVRDTVIPEYLDELDSLAGEIISRFSDDSLDTSKAAGAPGLFTDNGNALDSLNPRGVADRIQINAAVDPNQGGTISRIRDGMGATTAGDSGDSTLINGLLSAMTTAQTAPSGSKLSGSFSISGLAAGFSSQIGERSLRHEALDTGATARQNAMKDAEIGHSAVDTDQELQNLLLIEKSYAANARVIQTVSDMLDRLLQL